MDFIKFKNAVAIQFNRMASKPMFRTAVSGNDLWGVYLKSFPEGSNPIYKTKTEHDCNCCKQFIRAVGNVVNIVDGQLVSIWDIQEDVGSEYSVVAAALAAEVKLQIVCDVFLSPERTAGTHQSFQDIATGGVQTWNHFFVNIPGESVVRGIDIPTRLGSARSRHEVFHRAFTTIKKDAVDTVLELIGQNSLYRGGDHKATLQSFRKLIGHIDSNVGSAELWHRTWAVMCTIPDSVAFIRNTSIGTLLVALSEGEELEVAVGWT